MQNTSNALTTINNFFPKFKGMDKRIAMYILENPESILHDTIPSLSRKIGVSTSSIMRFCKLLGFSGFLQFKKGLSLDKKENPINFNIIFSNDDCHEIHNISETTDKVFNQVFYHLKTSREMLNMKLLSNAVDLISGCKKLMIVGAGTSQFTAEDAANRFTRIGFDTSSSSDPYAMLFLANELSEDSVMLAISNSGETKTVIDAVKMARSKNATIIGITSTANSSLFKLSDIGFVTSSAKDDITLKDPFTSRISHILVLDSIFASVVMKDYKKYKKKIDNISNIYNIAQG